MSAGKQRRSIARHSYSGVQLWNRCVSSEIRASAELKFMNATLVVSHGARDRIQSGKCFVGLKRSEGTIGAINNLPRSVLGHYDYLARPCLQAARGVREQGLKIEHAYHCADIS